ncbi:hypothetical protein [Beijerinckia indica]|uniref:Uncharacterized protein n=1 Tax=Beijerinckia indica subsp. indica (strain ATCC 9039 / DSM 1715 / NCIMB 8712) TaxID=395963 RepID=B2IL77_BEII9|nr:hypothetical protein [Beijerinckia indica]ACB97277.1 hypothetical protein Bind_3725 [Beijerinckia indica subsp. indica ATCC 9039]
MSTLDQYTEVKRYFSPKYRGMIVIAQEGVQLLHRLEDDDWKVLRRKKENVLIEEWLNNRKQEMANRPAWALDVQELPSMEQLEEWLSDGQCETPTGHEVEPDGHGPDGSPSWLLALGLI